MLGASTSFALMALFVKRVSVQIPEGEVVLFRSAVVLVVSLLFAARTGPIARLRGHSRGTLAVRGLFGVASMLCYFYAIHHLKLGDAVLLTYLSPIFISLFSPLVLRERVPPAIWVAIALGFGGVWVVASGAVAPGHATSELAGVILGLASAVLAAGAYLTVRRLSRTDDTATIVVWFAAVALLTGAVTCAFEWKTPSPLLLRDLLLVGGFAAIAQLLMTRAYAVAEAARVSIYGYLTPVLSYLLGTLTLHELPGWTGVAGTVLVALAGFAASDGVLRRFQRMAPRANTD